MSDKKPLKMGAVVYAPRVTVVWEIIVDYFKNAGLPMEAVFFKDYESQIDALLDGSIDIAWNSPLAHLDAELRGKGACDYGCMRDTDRDLHTYMIVRKDSGYTKVSDLKGKTIGFGAFDSPQARLIPMYYLHTQGLEYGKDYTEKRYDIGLGLHGDHVGGEQDAMEALKRGEVEASFTLDRNYKRWAQDGTLDKEEIVILAETPAFDHCIFTMRPGFPKEQHDQFIDCIMQMDYNNPEHKKMMDLEGLKEWVPGRLSGFHQIQEANKYLDFFPSFVQFKKEHPQEDGNK